jgi:hypothetical protein
MEDFGIQRLRIGEVVGEGGPHVWEIWRENPYLFGFTFAQNAAM